MQGFEELLESKDSDGLILEHACVVTNISLPEDQPWLSAQWRRAESKPDLLVGAGRAVQWPMLRTRWHLGGRTVVLMKPSLPLFLFDLILLPEHDAAPERTNIITTIGMLSPVLAGEKQALKGVILLGGLNKHFYWDNNEVADKVANIIKATPDISWQILDSPRTPATLVDWLVLPENIGLVHWQNTAEGWLGQQLASSEYVWVTADSASMLYEALSYGARVGVIELSPFDAKNKLVQGLAKLFKKSWLGRSSRGALSEQNLQPAGLAEHRRCARLIMQRWFS